MFLVSEQGTYNLSQVSIVCPDCQLPIDPLAGRWVPRNPQSTWGDGFWICHCMVPWLNYDEILDRQRMYDLPKFKNEVLGLPTTAKTIRISTRSPSSF